MTQAQIALAEGMKFTALLRQAVADPETGKLNPSQKEALTEILNGVQVALYQS